ncbi:hypothetical protein D3C77_603810 [compost metagenome]
MSFDHELELTKYEAILEDEKMLPEHRQMLTQLLAQIQELQAENGRLRKAVLHYSHKGSRMSTKLKDALYE